MKAIILCGGFGTRFSEKTKTIPKPMIKIGTKPVLIHIVENFVSQGFNQFVFCLGHKSETIISVSKSKRSSNLLVSCPLKL